jgi:hypothetical protein
MAPKTTAKDCTKRQGKAKQLLSLLKNKSNERRSYRIVLFAQLPKNACRER